MHEKKDDLATALVPLAVFLIVQMCAFCLAFHDNYFASICLERKRDR